jgi:GNAT superfamily N-acetyltransferase
MIRYRGHQYREVTALPYVDVRHIEEVLKTKTGSAMGWVTGEIYLPGENGKELAEEWVRMYAEEYKGPIKLPLAVLEHLYVHKKYRNTGVGAKLVKKFLQKVRSAKLVFVLAEPDESNLSFDLADWYTKFGFKPVRGGTNQDWTLMIRRGRTDPIRNSAERQNQVTPYNQQKAAAAVKTALRTVSEQGGKSTATATKFKKPTKAMVDFFKKRTSEHINRVIKYLKALRGTEGLSNAELMKRAKVHDKDKYTDKELILPYIWLTEWHRIDNEGGPISDELQAMKDLTRDATGKHIKNNLHHPEAHSSPKDMSNLDLAEMVADWAAMAEELGEGSPRGWADKNVGSKWKFFPEQRDFIYSLIDRLE